MGEIFGFMYEWVLYSNCLLEENLIKVLNVLVFRWMVGIYDIVIDKEMILFLVICLGNIILLCCWMKFILEFDMIKSMCF